MKISVTKIDDRCRLKADGEFNIYSAVDFKVQLLVSLTQCRSLEVDVSGVTEIDTAGVQMLILAKREAAQRAVGFRMDAHGGAVGAALKLYNLAGFFEAGV